MEGVVSWLGGKLKSNFQSDQSFNLENEDVIASC